MRELIEKWCIDNDFDNLKFTSDGLFATADGIHNKLLIIIKDENYKDPDQEDINTLYKTAYRTGQRQIWIIELKDGDLEWSLF